VSSKQSAIAQQMARPSADSRQPSADSHNPGDTHTSDRERRLRARSIRLGPVALAVLACVLVCALAMPRSARADEAIRVVRDTYQVQFAQGIRFHIELTAPSPIQEVTLYYLQVGQGLTVKVPLAVAPGQSTFEYTWALESGDLPVGASLQYYWRIKDKAGNELRTAPTGFSYDDDRFAWKPLVQGTITLFWYGSDLSRAQRLLGYATQALSRLQQDMGITVDQPIRIYVYETKSDMSLALPRQSDAYDDRVLTLGVVVDKGTLLILGSHPDVEGTMAHEMAHVVVGLATDNPYAELPRWLDEGLAMVSEGDLPTDNQRALDDAVRRDTLISVHSLSGYTGDPSEVDLFYGEVYSLVQFMLKTYGKDKMSQLLSAVREGLYQDEALQQVYGFGLDELDAQWRASLGLGPRPTPGTPAPGSTPSTQRPATRPSLPCAQWLSALLAVAVAAGRRRHAGTA
jgi:hypothetical protein